MDKSNEAVAEQPQQAEPQAAPVVSPFVQRSQDDREFILHLSLPDAWTESHYTIYTKAESAARARGVDVVLARYYGALALFKSQDVRVVNLPKLQELLSKKDEDQVYVPLAVKGAIIRAVANPLEAAVDQPFLALLIG